MSRGGVRLATNSLWLASSSAIGKFPSSCGKGHFVIACVKRLITAIWFKSGKFTKIAVPLFRVGTIRDGHPIRGQA
jgi:hypothetical protein